MNLSSEICSQPSTPYSLSPGQCLPYFGIKKKRIYDLIAGGKLHRGYHYLKVGKSIVIIVEKFIEWMKEVDHGNTN